MEHVESSTEHVELSSSVLFTGEVIYVDIYFKGTTERITLRIPVSIPAEEESDNYISYEKVVEQVDAGYQIGSEGHIQLPHHPIGQTTSTLFYALVGNILGIYVHPPQRELS